MMMVLALEIRIVLPYGKHGNDMILIIVRMDDFKKAGGCWGGGGGAQQPPPHVQTMIRTALPYCNYGDDITFYRKHGR